MTGWRHIFSWDVVPEELHRGQTVRILASTCSPNASTIAKIGMTGVLDRLITSHSDYPNGYWEVFFPDGGVWCYNPEDLEVIP
jgi:hypothetical protein